MSGPSIPIEPELTTANEAVLSLRFDDEAAFVEAFATSLGSGAAFVVTRAPAYAPRQKVDVALDLVFCGTSLTLPAEIVAVVEPSLAEVAESEPGVSLRFEQAGPDLTARLEDATGLRLCAPPVPAAERRARSRAPSDSDIRITTDDGVFDGTTANLSYAGVLALLPMTAIPVGTEVRVELSNPMVELDIPVDGRVVHSRRCDAGMIAHGIQLQYPAERIDEVMAFIEFLQSFDRARRLAIVAGPIESGGVSAVLDLFAHTAPAGTLVLTNGDDRGKIVFSENYLLRCTAGMATGMKALARLFLWNAGRFEFHHDLQLASAPEDPQPLEPAMMMASVQVDELHRIGFEQLQPDDAFTIERALSASEREKLSEIEREALDYAADGFNVEAISDMIHASDAEICAALLRVLETGAIRRPE